MMEQRGSDMSLFLIWRGGFSQFLRNCFGIAILVTLLCSITLLDHVSATNLEEFDNYTGTTSFCEGFGSYSDEVKIYCGFKVCTNTTVLLSSCRPELAKKNCSSGVVFDIYDQNHNFIASNASYVMFEPNMSSSTCKWFNVHQYCEADYVCNATTLIFNGNYSAIATQRFAVSSLKLTTERTSQWTTSTNWGNWNVPLKSWFGITTDTKGFVTQINIQGNNLNGYLTCDLFANLRYLTQVFLVKNSLTSTIPDCVMDSDFYTSKMVTFRIGFNYLTGTIPDSSFYKALTDYGLTSNFLTGTIPNSYALKGTMKFYASYFNILTGTLPPFPAPLISCNVKYNYLTGSIPLSFANDLNLNQLNIQFNIMSGTIPTFLGVTALNLLIFDGNQLSGTLPSFSNNVNLVALAVSRNKYLTGTLSSSLCSLPTLMLMFALASNFTCYQPCVPAIGYFDYLTESSIYDNSSSVFAKSWIDVCVNSSMGIDVLCDLEKSLNIVSNLPAKVEHITDTETIDNLYPHDPVTVARIYEYVDSSPLFVRYGISVDVHTIIGYNSRYNRIYVTICDGTVKVYSNCAHYGPIRFPGISTTPIYTTFSSSMFINVTHISNDLLLNTDSMGFMLSVSRYHTKDTWYCNNPVAVPNPCNWYGITCSQNAYIVSIDLPGLSLTGSVPASIGQLTALRTLNLRVNSITGTLPASIGWLNESLVTLDVSHNELSGIPSQLKYLYNLQEFYINANSLSGTLPTFLAEMTNLEMLDVNSNQFEYTFPQEFCGTSSNSGPTINAQSNLFTCVEGCYDNLSMPERYLLDSTIGICAPSSAPTSMPTSPTSWPTSAPEVAQQLTEAAIIGIAIIIAVCLIIAYIIWKAYLHYAEYADKPMHKALLTGKFIDLNTIKKYKLSELHVVNSHHQTPLDLLCVNKLYDQISFDALMYYMENSLHFNPETGEFVPDVCEHRFSWAVLVQQDNELTLSVIQAILKKYDQYIEMFVDSIDMAGRRCIDLCSETVREELIRCQYLHRRYELKVGPAEHKSATTIVHFAIDHDMDGRLPYESIRRGIISSDDDDDTTTNRSSLYGGSKPELARSTSYVERAPGDDPGFRVVLKFMKHRYQYLAELNVRSKLTACNLETTARQLTTAGITISYGINNLAVPILQSYDGDSDTPDNVAFRASAIRRGLEQYPYCIVMPLYKSCSTLQRIIEQQRIAGEDWDYIRMLIRQLSQVVMGLHTHVNVIHGDIKPQNVLVTDNNTVRLIDFDSSASFAPEANDGKIEYAGLRCSSAYLPPEMFYQTVEGRYIVRSYTKDSQTGEMQDVRIKYLSNASITGSGSIAAVTEEAAKKALETAVDSNQTETVSNNEQKDGSNDNNNNNVNSVASSANTSPDSSPGNKNKQHSLQVLQSANQPNRRVPPLASKLILESLIPTPITPQQAIHAAGYTLVEASPTLDVWALGVLFFKLCTGLSLFKATIGDSVSVIDEKHIWVWDHSFKESKLSLVDNKFARNLLSLFLSKNPNSRARLEDVLLTHPFITGKQVGRVQGEESKYDVFISYRKGVDDVNAGLIAKQLRQKYQLKVWLHDNRTLTNYKSTRGSLERSAVTNNTIANAGRASQADTATAAATSFMEGLANATCFVCLLSKKAINHPEIDAFNFTKLTPDSDCDNIVLQWRIALELRARQMIEGVFPVFIGNSDYDGDAYTDYFSSGCHPSPIPDIAVESVEHQLREHLEKQGLGLPLESRRTVLQLAGDITANQGGFLRGEQMQAINTICESIDHMRITIRTKANNNNQSMHSNNHHNSSSSNNNNSSSNSNRNNNSNSNSNSKLSHCQEAFMRAVGLRRSSMSSFYGSGFEGIAVADEKEEIDDLITQITELFEKNTYLLKEKDRLVKEYETKAIFVKTRNEIDLLVNLDEDISKLME